MMNRIYNAMEGTGVFDCMDSIDEAMDELVYSLDDLCDRIENYFIPDPETPAQNFREVVDSLSENQNSEDEGYISDIETEIEEYYVEEECYVEDKDQTETTLLKIFTKDNLVEKIEIKYPFEPSYVNVSLNKIHKLKSLKTLFERNDENLIYESEEDINFLRLEETGFVPF